MDTNKFTVLGVDPGIHGATVLLTDDQTGYQYFIHEGVNRSSGMDGLFDPKSYEVLLMGLLAIAGEAKIIACIEAPLVLSGQQRQGLIGINWGIIYSALFMNVDEVNVIRPADWSKMMLPGALRRHKLTPKQHKLASVVRAQELGYGIPYKPTKTNRGTTPNDNVADALLLALYQKEKLGGVVANEQAV